MLKLIVIGFMSAILNILLLNFKFVAYDLKDESAIGNVIGIFDLLKDFIVIFMMLWYVLK